MFDLAAWRALCAGGLTRSMMMAMRLFGVFRVPSVVSSARSRGRSARQKIELAA